MTSLGTQHCQVYSKLFTQFTRNWSIFTGKLNFHNESRSTQNGSPEFPNQLEANRSRDSSVLYIYIYIDEKPTYWLLDWKPLIRV